MTARQRLPDLGGPACVLAAIMQSTASTAPAITASLQPPIFRAANVRAVIVGSPLVSSYLEGALEIEGSRT